MADASRDFGSRSFGTASGSPGISSGTSGFDTGAGATGGTQSTEDTGLRDRVNEAREKVTEAAGNVGERISGMTSQARDMMNERMSQVRDMDWSHMSDNAMNYARQNPGQAILISAGVGFVLGLMLRPNRY
jgi:ElaB/YqjD/DUF883 family membrane-anchored ribosome-binding protein